MYQNVSLFQIGVIMKPAFERVSHSIMETVKMLCKNGLHYKHQLKIEGVIGITMDCDQLFLVHINENYTTEILNKQDSVHVSVNNGPSNDSEINGDPEFDIKIEPTDSGGSSSFCSQYELRRSTKDAHYDSVTSTCNNVTYKELNRHETSVQDPSSDAIENVIN